MTEASAVYCQRKQVCYERGMFLHPLLHLCVLMFSYAGLCGTHKALVCSPYLWKRQRACFSWVPWRGLDIVIFYQLSFLCQALTVSQELPFAITSFSCVCVCFGVCVTCVDLAYSYSCSWVFSDYIQKQILAHLEDNLFPQVVSHLKA